MYKLEVETKGPVLTVTVSGELNPETDLAIDEDIRRECETQDVMLVLIDLRPASTRLSIIDNFSAAESFGQRMGRNIRAVAIIDDLAYRNNSEMFELTAVNRGAAVRFFEEKASAVSWLGHYLE